VSRVPIRVRLAALVALAMMLVLAGAGLFVYLRLQGDLDESVDSTLEARVAAVAASGRAAAGSAGDDEDGFAQRLSDDGRLLDRTGGPAGIVLTRAELAEAAGGDDVEAEREVDGVDGTTRLLAERHGATVVVAGQSLEDRDETLAALAGAFALGAPVAAIVVALLGYGLAAAGLRPVERIRRRADEVSLEGEAEPLPLPAARDEIRRLGETLNAMLDRLRRSYARERRFVADASHELRTPVAVIKAELEAALRRAPDDPDLREALTAAVEECDRLAQLAEDLLVLARSGDGALAVRPEPLDAAELLERIRTRFSARARERGRELLVSAEPGLAVTADELRLSQALGNLVDNALRHGAGAITLSARRAGSAVELEVADEGAGPPPELRPRAFERFARGDEARTRGGAGLGLAIVRAIAEAHGGSAELAAGSAVRVRLPSQGDPSSRPYGAPIPTEGGTA
jgi:two-component system, OmpR family, sensor kinase